MLTPKGVGVAVIQVGTTHVSLAAFGAPGVGDATPVLAAALRTGATTIVIPPGRWRVVTWGALPPIRGRTLLGQPGAVVEAVNILPAAGGLAWSDLTFRGVTFTNPRTPRRAANFAWFAGDMAGLTFEDCAIVDGTTSFLNGTRGPVTFRRCRFTQTANPPATLNMSIGNVHGPFTVTACVFDFRPHSPAGVLVQVYGPPAPGPVTITGNTFLGGRWGGVIDGAIDIEPHGVTGGPVTVVGNRITNGSLYLAGVATAVVAGNIITFTEAVYQGHAAPLVGYTSATPKPRAGALTVIGNTVVMGPGTLAAPIPLVSFHGGGAVDSLTLAANTFVWQATSPEPVTLGWWDPSVTPGWGTLTLQQNRWHVTSALPAGSTLGLVTVGAPAGALDTLVLVDNTYTGPPLAGWHLRPRAGLPRGRIGGLRLAGNTAPPGTGPVVVAAPDVVARVAALGPNPGWGPPTGLPPAAPLWPWVVGAGLAAAGAGYAAWRIATRTP